MTVKVQCPNPACGHTADIADEHLGRPGRCSRCGHALPPHTAPADLPPELANHPRYRILRELGRGGMGIVYQARQLVMDREVVIKVVSKGLLDNADAVERFQREVRAAAKLAHPNIVTAYDAEQAGELHMLVMEFVPGHNLAEVLRKKGPLPLMHACVYVRQAALGLQHAHEQGMVHRDIKPHNLMLTPKGQVKILDFGLAKMVSENRPRTALTALGSYMGTPEYSAPEQAKDARSADIRADIYSLGCTLYCLLAGRPPFQEETPVLTILAHLEKEPTPLPELRADVPAALGAVVARLLAKDPAQRYQQPVEVAQALAPFCKPATPAPAQAAPATAPAAGGRTAAAGLPGQVSRMPPPAPASPVTVSGSPFADLDADVQPRQSAKAAAAPAPAGRLWWMAGGALVGGVCLVLVSGLCAGLLVLAGWGRNAPASREPALVSASTVHADEATGKEGSLPMVSIKEPGPTQPRPALAEPREPEPTPPPPRVAEPKQPEPAPPPSPAKDFTNSLGMKFVRVPHGTFWMGDRGKQRPAEIPRDFYIGCYLVTQEQWQAVMGSNPSFFSRQGGGADKVKGIAALDLKQFPVEEVSWDDVQDFLKRLNVREKDRGFVYRLPTEAEWEYACRGGATSQEDCAFDFYVAQPTNDLSSAQANFDGNHPAGNAPKGPYLERPTKVGSYPPNRLGLYDMHGNVWEWCEDSYDGGSARVVRGGSWDRNGSRCRASYRGTHEPANRYRALGVRLVAVPSGE